MGGKHFHLLGRYGWCDAPYCGRVLSRRMTKHHTAAAAAAGQPRKDFVLSPSSLHPYGGVPISAELMMP